MALSRNKRSPVKSKNSYLSDPDKGLDLLSKIMAPPPASGGKFYTRLDQLIDEDLLSCVEDLELPNELGLRSRLMSVSDRFMAPGKYRLLGKKSVVGLGGQFSAGKSTFLNSLLGEDFSYKLPENSSPSTAVPTYIVSGEKNSAFAYTINRRTVDLDEEALNAISHEFRNTYDLGLAQYLFFLAVITTHDWGNLVLLDTPGYNREGSGTLASFTDFQKAYSQLRSIDYLIWLIDVTNGTLSQEDIKFIKTLGMQTKILLVVNKCDLVPESQRKSVFQAVRQTAVSSGIPVFDVAGYSATEPDLEGGLDRVNAFFDYARKRESHVEDLQTQLREITTEISNAFEQTHSTLSEKSKEIGMAIFHSTDVSEVGSLIHLYSELKVTLGNIRENRRRFCDTESEIRKLTYKLDRIGSERQAKRGQI